MADINANQLTIRDNFTLQDKIVTGNSGTGEFTAPTDIKTFFENIGMDIEVGYVSLAESIGSFDTSTQDSDATGIYLDRSGFNFYMVGATTKSVHQYTLGTAFDISTCVFIRTFDPSSDDNDVRGVSFNNDLTKMYLTGGENTSIYEYTMSSAGDISTTTLTHTLDISANTTDPKGITFDSDGSNMYFCGTTPDDRAYEYALSTDFDLSTATSTDFFEDSGVNHTDIKISNDGLVLYILDRTDDVVNAYSLTTANDISTASTPPFSFYDPSAQETSPASMFIDRTFDNMYIQGFVGDDVFQYSLSKIANNSLSGTFTPELAFAGGSTGITYFSQQGIYIRNGNSITLNINMRLTSKGTDTGIATISVPFPGNNVGNYAIANSRVAVYENIPDFGVQMTPSSDPDNLFLINSSSGSALFDTDFANDSEFYFSITYLLA